MVIHWRLPHRCPRPCNFERPHECGEILVVTQYELRTCHPQHRVIGVSSDSHEPQSKACCRSDIAVGIAHENDPLELLLMMKSRASYRDARNLFALCGIICEPGGQPCLM
jgi:hypothetical protein